MSLLPLVDTQLHTAPADNTLAGNSEVSKATL